LFELVDGSIEIYFGNAAESHTTEAGREWQMRLRSATICVYYDQRCQPRWRSRGRGFGPYWRCYGISPPPAFGTMSVASYHTLGRPHFAACPILRIAPFE